MADFNPHIIIPNLVMQPTWGGYYIAKLKKLTQYQNPKLNQIKIGQSFELFQNTKLSQKLSTSNHPSIELSHPQNPDQTQLIAKKDKPLSIQQFIKLNPKAVLGPKANKVLKGSMQILIKLTQGKGNSYQIHAQPQDENKNWLSKPESWYYLEPGLITLGTRPKINWQEYQKTCKQIDSKVQQLSRLVKSKKQGLQSARNQLKSFIRQNNPRRFVNLIKVKKNQAIDLSPCGIHHSWEEDPARYPKGNVVYEVQKNVYDPASTIRCFDKGKIKDDGSVRPIHINDYFKYINHSPKLNNPKTHMRISPVINRGSNFTTKQVFKTKYYSLQEISFKGSIKNTNTQTKSSFHHLFVRSGNIKLTLGQQSWIVTQNYSIFIPSITGKYQLNTFKCKQAIILKTYV